MSPDRLTVPTEGRSGALSLTLTPRRRGEATIERAWVRWTGPLGLVWSQHSHALQRKIVLTPDIAGVKAEASALQLVDGYLRSVAQTGTGPEAPASANTAPRAATPTPAQITATAEVLRKSGQDSAARAHQLQRKQEALELALKPLVAERDRVASQRARVVSVTINVANGGLAALVLVKPVDMSYVREECRRPTSSPTESYGDAAESERIRSKAGSRRLENNAFLSWIGYGVAGSLASAPLVVA